ncbi:MAG: hypothetical protein P1U86_13390 [Verrucomicrobiales bacterium]|nr:hypothetical protein [Verrucomicrobiales bacterium]
MKPLRKHNSLRRQDGYTTFVVVAGVSLIIIAMTTFALRGNLTSTQTQARAQVKQDYSQKEDAMLNALIQIVPNKAIGAMKSGSQANASQYTWNQIFKDAAELANADESIAPELIDALSLSDALSANTGQLDFTKMEEFVVAPAETRDATFNHVNGGNWWEYIMLGDPAVGSQVPAALRLSYSDYLLDKRYPIISRSKTYVNWYQKGLSLSPDLYPDFNLLQYPDIKFGYKRPGELFVAKRNWWIFSLNFGTDNESITQIASVKKSYVLSIYEVPSQIPLSAATALQLGRHSNGEDWENISVEGGVYADEIQTRGTFDLTGGSLAAGTEVSINGTTTIDGTAIEADFDALGEREKRALNSQSDFHAASQGGNIGKVAFIPINQGADSLLKKSDGNRSLRLSPTGWHDYSRPANNTEMTVNVTEVSSAESPVPIEFEFTYRDDSGGTQTKTYNRASNWPTEQSPGGDSFPFQTEILEDTKIALITNIDRIPAFLASLGDAADETENNSLHLVAEPDENEKIGENGPVDLKDMAITLRGGKDLRPFSNGLSVVTNLRMYVGESLNTFTLPPPDNSGITAGSDFYPPLSLFAPEKRFGETNDVEGRVKIEGQLNSLEIDQSKVVNPLDIQGAGERDLTGDKIRADLKSLRSPAELPPVYQMNWLVTIEEIH